jgi:hypothetical protein
MGSYFNFVSSFFSLFLLFLVAYGFSKTFFAIIQVQTTVYGISIKNQQHINKKREEKNKKTTFVSL